MLRDLREIVFVLFDQLDDDFDDSAETGLRIDAVVIGVPLVEVIESRDRIERGDERIESRELCLLESRELCLLESRELCLLESRELCLLESRELCLCESRELCLLESRDRIDLTFLIDERRRTIIDRFLIAIDCSSDDRREINERLRATGEEVEAAEAAEAAEAIDERV